MLQRIGNFLQNIGNFFLKIGNFFLKNGIFVPNCKKSRPGAKFHHLLGFCEISPPTFFCHNGRQNFTTFVKFHHFWRHCSVASAENLISRSAFGSCSQQNAICKYAQLSFEVRMSARAAYSSFPIFLAKLAKGSVSRKREFLIESTLRPFFQVCAWYWKFFELKTLLF